MLHLSTLIRLRPYGPAHGKTGREYAGRPHDRRWTAPHLKGVAYHVWSALPPFLQQLTVRIFAPRVSLGACAVIRDARGRVLLAHHPYRRRAWGLPGGFIRGDEQPEAALAREIREELGVTATIGPLLGAHTALDNRHLTLYYAATLAGQPRVDGIEIDALRHVPEDALSTYFGPDALVWLSPADAAQAA